MALKFTATVSTVNSGLPTVVNEVDGLTVGQYFDQTEGRINGSSRSTFGATVNGSTRNWDYVIQNNDRVQFFATNQKNA